MQERRPSWKLYTLSGPQPCASTSPFLFPFPQSPVPSHHHHPSQTTHNHEKISDGRFLLSDHVSFDDDCDSRVMRIKPPTFNDSSATFSFPSPPLPFAFGLCPLPLATWHLDELRREIQCSFLPFLPSSQPMKQAGHQSAICLNGSVPHSKRKTGTRRSVFF